MRLLTVILIAIINGSYSYWASDFIGLLIDLENEDQNQEVHKTEVSNNEDNDLLANLKNKISRFVPDKNNFNFVEFLNSTQKEENIKVLENLIEAAKYIDHIYERQVFLQNPAIRKKLMEESVTSPLARAKLEYFDIMKGPWDRLNNSEPFAVETSKPHGGGFYPEENFDASKFRFYLAAHEDERSALENPVTIVKELNQTFPVVLQAVPYSQEYNQFLEPSANKLMLAANLTEDIALNTFLKSTAEAFRTNNYVQANKDWFALSNSGIQMAIGPHNMDVDQLTGLKAAFEAVVYIVDQDFNLKSNSKLRSGLAKDIDLNLELDTLLPSLESNLPVDDNMKNPDILQRGRSDSVQDNKLQNTIKIADLVYSSGAARTPIQPLVFSLTEKDTGVKKVLLRNVLYAKHDQILTRVANKLMKVKQLKQGNLDSDSSLYIQIFHMISQSLGPVYVGNQKNKGEIEQVLGKSFPVLEYCKSSVMGIYNLMQKFKEEALVQEYRNKILFTYIASLFTNLHVETENSVKKVASAVLLNKFLEERSIVRLKDGRYQVNYYNVGITMTPLIKEFVTLLYNGKQEDTDELIANYGVVKPVMEAALDTIKDLPVDIFPFFPSKF